MGPSARLRNHKGNLPTLPQTKSCAVCAAKFTRTTHLNRHMRSHTNERCYRCIICGAEFTRSDLLTRHKRTCSDSNSPKSRRRSCEACAESKIKCDLLYPCTKCSARGRECVYINDPEISRQKLYGSQPGSASPPESFLPDFSALVFPQFDEEDFISQTIDDLWSQLMRTDTKDAFFDIREFSEAEQWNSACVEPSAYSVCSDGSSGGYFDDQVNGSLLGQSLSLDTPTDFSFIGDTASSQVRYNPEDLFRSIEPVEPHLMAMHSLTCPYPFIHCLPPPNAYCMNALPNDIFYGATPSFPQYSHSDPLFLYRF